MFISNEMVSAFSLYLWTCKNVFYFGFFHPNRYLTNKGLKKRSTLTFISKGCETMLLFCSCQALGS